MSPCRAVVWVGRPDKGTKGDYQRRESLALPEPATGYKCRPAMCSRRSMGMHVMRPSTATGVALSQRLTVLDGLAAMPWPRDGDIFLLTADE
jgi:hypothetical protein